MRIYNIIPYEKIIIRTKLSPKDIAKRINDNTKPFKLKFGFYQDNNDFYGTTNEKEFRIVRNINKGRYYIKTRNSFTPYMIGTIEGNKINVTIRMHMPVIIFVCIWLFFTTIGALLILTNNISLNDNIIVILMPIIGYTIMMFGFKSELNKSKEALLKTVEGRIVDN
jgi:hypothetical protein